MGSDSLRLICSDVRDVAVFVFGQQPLLGLSVKGDHLGKSLGFVG